MNRRNTIYAFCLVSVVLILGAITLNYNLSPLFGSIDKHIENGETIVMNGSIDASRLEQLLIEGGYIKDPQDAHFISQWYKEKIESGEPLENLGAINSKRFRIPADTIKLFGGEELNSKLYIELEQLGQDSVWRSIDTSSLNSVFGAKSDSTSLIKVYVGEASQGKILGIIPKKPEDVSGVPVRITEHWTNKNVPSKNLSVSHGSKTIGFAVTDEDGMVFFYVPKGHSYSVLPIKEGYQFGQEQGTVKGPLVKDLDLIKFSQEKHKLRPFRSGTYAQLKKDNALISRSPAEFRNALVSDIVIFIGCWLTVFVVTGFMDKRQGQTTDSLLLISLMVLSGMGLLTLYGQMLPLSDIFNAHKMVNVFSCSLNNFSGGIIIGCALLLLLSAINYLKLFQRYRSKWLKNMGFGKNALVDIAPGLPFVIIAVIMMIMLRFLGSAPEGSDARVNLFGFQPSEIVKYLIVVFMAFFFYAKGDVIKTFGVQLTTLARKRYLIIISGVIIVIAAVCLLFLAMLKDMGPGIVILATFILLYSTARRDVRQLLLGIISYIVLVGCVYMVTNIVALRMTAVVAWFVVWIAYSWYRNKTIYESAIFFNVLVSLFLVGGYIIRPFLPHMADRLFNRTNMVWSGIFDNAIPQGDQIAQGLWGTASGGLTGMGIGGGSPYFIPAGHTDLILNSLGEQMGWLGILIIVVCFYILISRTAVAAQYSGHKFTFYLCLGIGLVTSVQFLFIALGCVGAIPLSGVPVPFMSYSGTSIVMALAAYGVVISISRHRGNSEALKSFVVNERREKDNLENAEAKSLNNNLFFGMLLLFIGCVCVTGINGYYQLAVSGKTQIRPAITSTNKGLRVLGYNPRITQVMDMLERGNIYDRNGILLATSDKSSLDIFSKIQDSIDISLTTLDEIKGKRLKRYYPFGNNTVFMVGDLNRSDVYANYGAVPMGYFAEIQNANQLCGFETHSRVMELVSPDYKFNRFLNTVSDTLKYKLHNYSELLPALSTSIYQNPWIEEFNKARHKRDIYLSIDAILQSNIQQNMAEHIKKSPGLSRLKDFRASVVVLDAKNGELLTSSNYPLPVTDSIINLRQLNLDTKSGVPSEWRAGDPITERDLGLTYQTAPGSTAKVMSAIAGFRKLGSDAYNQGFKIKPYMTVEPPTREPNTSMPSMNRNGGKLTFMENAIKYSSNCYYVMSLNENDLYSDLGDVYWSVGASLANIRPYFFSQDEYTASNKTRFDRAIKRFQTNGLRDYNKYISRTPKSQSWNPNSRQYRMSSIQTYTGIAWGQSQLEASPMNMARVAGLVANEGKLMPTRFLLNQEEQSALELIDSKSASLLASAMEEEASKWTSRNILPKQLYGFIGGKTGTPMRTIRGNHIMNDGWYICFIKNAEDGRTLSIAVRLERLPHGMVSTEAVKFMAATVLPALQECGYIK